MALLGGIPWKVKPAWRGFAACDRRLGVGDGPCETEQRRALGEPHHYIRLPEGIRIVLLQISRGETEKQAVDKGDVKFFGQAYLLRPGPSSGRITSVTGRLTGISGAATSSRVGVVYRTRQSRELLLVDNPRIYGRLWQEPDSCRGH